MAVDDRRAVRNERSRRGAVVAADGAGTSHTRDLRAAEETNKKERRKKLEEVKRKANPEEKPKFKVGDRVRFRDWDDMAKEFGTAGIGSIDCKCTFVMGMRHLCGTYATIESIDGYRVFLKDFTAKEGATWDYSTDMIELAEETLRTFEMVARAEGDGQTYLSGSMYYNRKTGFTNKGGKMWSVGAWSDREDESVAENLLNRSALYRFIHCDGWKPVEVRESVKEMTLEEIEKELGYKIKIK